MVPKRLTPAHFVTLLQRAIDQANAALLPPENAAPSLILSTCTQTLRKHLTPLLRPSWLDPILAERELLNESAESVVEHWIDLSTTLLAPFVINPLVNALKVPAFRSSIQIDVDDDMIPTFNTEFMPRNSSNSLTQMTQVEHLIRQELHLDEDDDITYLLCRDLDTAIQNLPTCMTPEWEAEFGQSHRRSLFPHLHEIGCVFANARKSTMIPIIGYIGQPFLADNYPDEWMYDALTYDTLYAKKSTATIAKKRASLICLDDWDSTTRLRSLEKFVLFAYPALLSLPNDLETCAN